MHGFIWRVHVLDIASFGGYMVLTWIFLRGTWLSLEGTWHGFSWMGAWLAWLFVGLHG